MNRNIRTAAQLWLVATILALSPAAHSQTPGYNTEIPKQIMTPETVETRLGTLKFQDGMPDAETVKLAYDSLDLMRGAETFLNGIPATSIEGIRRGLVSTGLDAAHKVGYFGQLMDSNPLFLTGNTDTVYGMAILDLKRDGATVIETPRGQGPTTVNDAYFRFVTDMGVPGPDKGEGGKYLILPPDYDGDLDPPVGGIEAKVDGETYFVSKSPSFVNWFIARGFLVDGKTDTAVNAYKEGLKIYPLSRKNSQPDMEFINLSKKVFNTIHANDFEFYEELNHVIQREPVDLIEPQLRGLFASIGIEKGKEFAPDERMRRLLTQAVAVGNATARAITFAPRDPSAYLYEGRYWNTAFIGGNYEWLKNGGNGGRFIDARTLFFYFATVNTPAMVKKIPGKGSQYAANSRDKDGNYLNGARTYKLTIPANAPAKDFWSVVVYDPQTRSELQTDQPFPSKNNKRDKLDLNEDGSVDLYFGPKAPAGKDNNWVQTVPGKNWFCLLRLYGPLEPWFDKSWQPGDFELVK